MALEKVAIIFVPGIFASHLIDPNGEVPAWPINTSFDVDRAGVKFTQTGMFKYFYDQSPTKKHTMMDKSARFVTSGAIKKRQPRLSWDSVAKAFYLPFFEHCHKNASAVNGYFEPEVWGTGYNFTQTNKFSGDVTFSSLDK